MLNNKFRVDDNLASIITKTIKPFFNDKTIHENFEDYVKLDNTDYSVYKETSVTSIFPKYTMVSSNPNSQSNDDSSDEENEEPTISPSIVPPMGDVMASKQMDESKMSTINTIYIGSLTVIGLYVLFRYLKH